MEAVNPRRLTLMPYNFPNTTIPPTKAVPVGGYREDLLPRLTVSLLSDEREQVGTF